MSDEALRLLVAVKREIDADAHLKCLLCYEEKGHCEDCPAPAIDAFLADKDIPPAREAVLLAQGERLEEVEAEIDDLDDTVSCIKNGTTALGVIVPLLTGHVTRLNRALSGESPSHVRD